MAFELSDSEVRNTIHKVCVKYQIDPHFENDQADFFEDLLELYPGEDSLEGLLEWLDEEIPKQFPAVGERPVWVQYPVWLFQDGEPMMFVCSVEVTREDYYHDTTVFYLFQPKGTWDDSMLRVVSQQY